MEGILFEVFIVFGINLDNEVDQKVDGKNDRKFSIIEVGKFSLVSKLLKKVIVSGKEEEVSIVFS